MTTPPAWAPATPENHIDDPRARKFADSYPQRPIPTAATVDTAPICLAPSTGLEKLWRSIVPETRTRANDLHLPIVTAYATRLCDVYPRADRKLVLIATALHDTGWAHVEKSRIISEGFRGDWRKAAIRFEHEREGCHVARRVLTELGYGEDFIQRVCEIIDGHDTRHVAYSLEDALVRDSDRLWRFDRAGIAMSCTWFDMDPATYVDRLEAEIMPELITDAAHQIARADLARCRDLLRTEIIR